MNTIKIRPATINDIPSIVELRVSAVTEGEISEFGVPEDKTYTSVDKLRSLWSFGNRLQDGFEVFVAEDQGRVVGFIVFTAVGRDNIDNIVVAIEEQGRGIGRSLVEYVECIARSRGISSIRTDTTENSMGVAWKAYSFWIKLGFEDSGARIPTKYFFKIIPLVKKIK